MKKHPTSLLISAVRLNLAVQVLIEGLRLPKTAMAALRNAQAEFTAAWSAWERVARSK
jgi:hypothetical protein